ncbi:MAG: hypothetical protein NUV97_03760 [archaeon]|nr:hypothetical protein [archaeon]MCR4323866.1 hypothetical protein [Nanoarchaeota archaeon]
MKIKYEKKAAFLWNNTFSLIIGAAIVVLLVIFFFMILAPVYDRADEIAKANKEALVKELEKAALGNGGEFSLWGLPEDGVAVYLVYFGGEAAHVTDDFLFWAPNAAEHNLCICYFSGQVFCKHCIDLEADEVVLNGSIEKSWSFKENQNGETARLKIIKEDGAYVFEKI